MSHAAARGAYIVAHWNCYPEPVRTRHLQGVGNSRAGARHYNDTSLIAHFFFGLAVLSCAASISGLLLMVSVGQILWQPSQQWVENTNLHHYRVWLKQRHNLEFSSYQELRRWSLEHLDDFWQSIWDYFSGG